MPNLEEQLYLILFLGHTNLFGKKKKVRYSYFKILYQIYLYSKNVDRGKWTSIFPSVPTIAEHSQLDRDTVKEFTCSPAFQVFGEKIVRTGKTNQYRLYGWVTQLFKAFERLGMMQKFQSDFMGWKKTFCKRVNGAFLELVKKGYSLNEVMNKLLTKRPLKSAGSKPLKSATTTYPSGTTHSGSKSNYEPGGLPVFDSLKKVSKAMKKVGLRDGDINQFIAKHNLAQNKRALEMMFLWKKRGMEMRNPASVYQKCLNETGKRAA